MKNIAYILLSFVVLTACQNGTDKKNTLSQSVETTKNIVKNLENQRLPDKRDHIFNVEVQEKEGKIILTGTTDYKDLLNKITDSLTAKNINFRNRVKQLPLPEFKYQIGITRLSVANLRALPKHSAELVTQTLMGMPLQIFEQQNDFYHVKTPEGYYAWVDAAGIVILDKKAYKQWLQQDKIIVTANYTTTYSKPDTNSLPVSDAVLNDVFSLLQIDDNFALVGYPDGRKAYLNTEDFIKMDFFDAANKQYATEDDLKQAALRYLGIPYLWGGTSIKGLDCSGFTKNVYAQFGYLLPRDASQQVKIGQAVKLTGDLTNLTTGDLLFFGHQKNGQDKITHVAIYIGNGKIIHATGEVKIESLNPNDPDYNDARKKTLLQARRILRIVPQKFSSFYVKKNKGS